MKGQDSITPSDFTNFLAEGALLRQALPEGQVWHLVWGPFKESKTPFSEGISIFCPDFYDIDSASYRRGSRTQSLNSSDFESLLRGYLSDNKAPVATVEWTEPSRFDFENAFAMIQRKITSYEIRKAVPVVFRRAKTAVSAKERAQILLNLLQAPPTLFVHGYWSTNGGIIGATPETLFTQKENRLQTMALAGTCPKSEAAGRPSLLDDPKEMKEHDFVVQDLDSTLSRYGKITREGPHLLELPTLFHLQTKFSVETKRVDPGELIKALHPTPALGVFPRRAGYQWMKDLPGQQGRMRFGAPFAFIWPDEVVCLVSIRNIQWSAKERMIGSGCGIVGESQVDREWAELQQKRLSVQKILGLQ